MVATVDSSYFSSHRVDVSGASLYYEEHGTGPVLLLVHGGPVSSAMWQAVIPHLVDSVRVITPDSRGHGQSTNPVGELTFPLLADDVAALIHAMGLDRPPVGGWSDGSQIALELGARHPGVAGGLIVGAAHPDFAGTGLRETHRQLLSADETGVPDIPQMEEHYGDFAELVKSWHPGGDQQWHSIINQTAPMWLDYPGLTPELRQCIVDPTLVLIGDRDEMFPTEVMLLLSRELPHAEFAVCP